jgi:uncharacterized protein
MTERNPLIAERIGPYYVYVLVDPRSGKPFYVGKGTGDRFRSHGDVASRTIEAALLEADSDATSVERKNRLTRIREIRNEGLEPTIAFARTRIPTEPQAYLVEAAVIDSLDAYAAPLVNEVRGHHTPDGLTALDDLERELTTEVFTTQTPAILIKLFDWVSEVDPDTGRPGYGYRPGMTQPELLESVRAWWVLGSKREKYQYVVAVHDGITRGVWEVVPGKWASWTPRPNRRLRWSFVGREAPPVIQEMFLGRIGRRVPAVRPDGRAVFGPRQPIAYWPR